MGLGEKKAFYQKRGQVVYRNADDPQRLLIKKGMRGATTIVGAASVLLSNSPLLAQASEIIPETKEHETVQVPSTEHGTDEQTSDEITDTPNDTAKETPSTGGEGTTGEAETPTEPTPTEPTQPEKPKEPVVPAEPETPTTPEEPSEPTEPVTPTKPVTPEKPKQPVSPEKPVTPENKDTNNQEEIMEEKAPVQETQTPAATEQPVKEPVQVVSTVTSPITNSEVPASAVASDGSIHFEKDESVESFIRKIGEPARKIGQENDLYASVMIAQAILESGSGSSELSKAPNYNLFGIKGSHEGNSVSFNTQEDQGNGSMVTIQDSFRKYSNYEESLDDYAELLKEGISGNQDFYSGAWKTNAKTYEEATKFLTGKYATDTQYNQKLNGLIETYDLTEYDKEASEATVSATGFVIPVKNYTISSPFGPRGGEFHRGLDFAAAQGEPIYASKAGTVTAAEFHYSWGNHVTISHDDGMMTLYAHQAQYVVQPGDKVEQGQIIGYVGNTGNSTGSHLHFEVCKDGSLSADQLLNPETILFG
ncbi:hypothetical protein IGK47_001669 [Enterococcus sp. AZ007]